MTRDEARDKTLEAVDREREWQATRFSTEHDDTTVHTDLNHMVAVITKYLGMLAEQAVRQADYKDVDLERVAIASVKVAAVSTAIAESLIFTGRVPAETIMLECHGGPRDAK